jgi:putative transposase
MARLARVVIPGIPHHITQRGNRRQATFFGEDDYGAYRELMAAWCDSCGVQVWAWCLMPNHVHLVAVPREGDSLHRGLGEAHRRYTRRVNFRQGWRGHLWQGRFASYPLDEGHLWAAVRYVERNPVRAGLVAEPHQWAWSSARAHLGLSSDRLTTCSPVLDDFGDWRRYLSETDREADLALLRLHERTGRPLGDAAFLEHLEQRTGRRLRRSKPGPKPTRDGR